MGVPRPGSSKARVAPEAKRRRLGSGVCISELGWSGERGLTLRNKALRSRPLEAPRRETTHSSKIFG